MTHCEHTYMSKTLTFSFKVHTPKIKVNMLIFMIFY